MVDRFFLWAKEIGAGFAEVTANSVNTDAVRFYERNGFTPQSTTLNTKL